MNQPKIGIGDISIYIPSPRLDMKTLLENRALTHPELERMFARTIKKTGLVSFRFPEPWEDTASLAANAAASILDRMSKEEQKTFRYLSVGTETAIDYSKPVASYVQGMLQNAGYPIGSKMTTFEVKHACAGGTTAMLTSAAMLGYSENPQERAMAISSDIARYEAPSTAEVTQGAGAVAIMLEKNPGLLELDLGKIGLYASDVDDFYRPLGSVTARVKGRYSMECYQHALEGAMDDFCDKSGCRTCEILEETDYLAFHVPFPTMPESALRKLLKNRCGKNSGEIDQYIERTGFTEALYLSSSVGNLYTGSLFAYIAALLNQEYRKIGNKIIGKRILIASYGSGNTMILFSAEIASKAPDLIKNWNIDKLLSTYKDASFDEYLQWLARPRDTSIWKNLLEGAKPNKGEFYLKDFNDAELRIYNRAT